MTCLQKMIKMVLIVFLVATAVILVLALAESGNLRAVLPGTFGRFLAIFYMALLVLAILALVVGVLLGAVSFAKKNGTKQLLKQTGVFFSGDLAATVVLSLVRDGTAFSPRLAYLPFVFALLPLAGSVFFSRIK